MEDSNLPLINIQVGGIQMMQTKNMFKAPSLFPGYMKDSTLKTNGSITESLGTHNESDPALEGVSP